MIYNDIKYKIIKMETKNIELGTTSCVKLTFFSQNFPV